MLQPSGLFHSNHHLLSLHFLPTRTSSYVRGRESTKGAPRRCSTNLHPPLPLLVLPLLPLLAINKISATWLLLLLPIRLKQQQDWISRGRLRRLLQHLRTSIGGPPPSSIIQPPPSSVSLFPSLRTTLISTGTFTSNPSLLRRFSSSRFRRRMGLGKSFRLGGCFETREGDSGQELDPRGWIHTLQSLRGDQNVPGKQSSPFN